MVPQADKSSKQKRIRRIVTSLDGIVEVPVPPLRLLLSLRRLRNTRCPVPERCVHRVYDQQDDEADDACHALSTFRKMESIVSATATSDSGITCAYTLSVTLMLEWPRRLAMKASETFWLSRAVA